MSCSTYQGGESEIKFRYHINNQLIRVYFMTYQNNVLYVGSADFFNYLEIIILMIFFFFCFPFFTVLKAFSS